MNTITLAQSVKDGKELASLNYPTLITTINRRLADLSIKVNQSDTKPIAIWSVHRHPSNNLVLYTTTSDQEDALIEQHDKWVHLLSKGLALHNPVHSVVVHGIPTSFNPTDPQHLEMLGAMNPNTLNPPPMFVKWISANAVQQGETHSSIRIGFSEADRATQAVEQKIFYGRFNKHTEFGRKIKPRCMDCLKEGHITRHCKEKVMCPYCSEEHTPNSCNLQGKMTTNCTACARNAQTLDSAVDLKSLFAKTSRYLCHSPLDQTCPAQIAGKKAQALKPPQQPADKSTPTSANTGNRGQGNNADMQTSC